LASASTTGTDCLRGQYSAYIESFGSACVSFTRSKEPFVHFLLGNSDLTEAKYGYVSSSGDSSKVDESVAKEESKYLFKSSASSK